MITGDAKELTFDSGYMGPVWHPTTVARAMRATLADVDYDTMVGTGLSGALIVPALARSLRKKALIIRKSSSHSGLNAEGKLGQRWLFVDDFVASGDTLRRVQTTMNGIVDQRNRYLLSPSTTPKFKTEYVGVYQYTRDMFQESGHEHYL